jgi:transposase-like protein
MVRTYLRTGHGRHEQEKLKKAVESVLAERQTFGKAAEEYGLRKTTVFYAVKRARKPLTGIERKGVETVLAQELAVSEVIGNPLRTIFMKKQEKELSTYLQKCSLMNHGLTPKAVQKFTYDWALTLSIAVPKN